MNKKQLFPIFIILLISITIVCLSFISFKYLNSKKLKETNIDSTISLFTDNKEPLNSSETYTYFDSFYTLLKHYKLYIIKFGDTLWKIKKKFKLKDYSRIIRLNKIKNPDLIYSGDIIKIPQR